MARKATEANEAPAAPDEIAALISRAEAFHPGELAEVEGDTGLKLNDGDVFGPVKYLGRGKDREFADDDGIVRRQQSHRFELTSGTTVRITGRAMLNTKLERVRKGTQVTICFVGIGGDGVGIWKVYQ